VSQKAELEESDDVRERDIHRVCVNRLQDCYEAALMTTTVLAKPRSSSIEAKNGTSFGVEQMETQCGRAESSEQEIQASP
jgi:hypothetical protein